MITDYNKTPEQVQTDGLISSNKEWGEKYAKVDQALLKAQKNFNDLTDQALEISKERDDMRQYLEKLQGLLFGDRTYAAEVEELKELFAQYPKQ